MGVDLEQTRHMTRKGGQDETYRVGSSAKTREKKAKNVQSRRLTTTRKGEDVRIQMQGKRVEG